MSVLHFLKKNSFVFALELYIFEAYIWWYCWYYLQIQPTQPLRKTKTLKTTRKGVEETAVKVPLPEGAEGGYPEKSRVRQLLKQAVQYKLLAFHVDLWWIFLCLSSSGDLVFVWMLYRWNDIYFRSCDACTCFSFIEDKLLIIHFYFNIFIIIY